MWWRGFQVPNASISPAANHLSETFLGSFSRSSLPKHERADRVAALVGNETASQGEKGTVTWLAIRGEVNHHHNHPPTSAGQAGRRRPAIDGEEFLPHSLTSSSSNHGSRQGNGALELSTNTPTLHVAGGGLLVLTMGSNAITQRETHGGLLDACTARWDFVHG